ncbi:MAG TPA: hypothetical protein VJU61_16390, partial [Polyangiaceae bacterium]|nr:hypothetical protein [Polyangiaceae bacterium]
MTDPSMRRSVARAGVALAVLGALACNQSPTSSSTATSPTQAPEPSPARAPAPSSALPEANPAPDAPVADAEPVDGGWPRESTTASGASLVVYQPQIASWADQKNIVLYAAVSYTAKGAEKAALGTIKAESRTEVATSERLVSFADLRITETHFSTLQPDQLRKVVEELQLAMPREERVIALDRVLANLDKSQIIPKNVAGVKAEPPPIYFSTERAILVNLDGTPIWSGIKENDLQFAVNTNWDLFRHTQTQQLFLRVDDSWLAAPALEGPWQSAGALPDSFSKLPNDDNWKAVRAALPGKLGAGSPPTVFTTTVPAELVLLRGAPQYERVEGTSSLFWVENTDSDLFRVTETGPVYFLVAGRWFSAPDFGGPWTFASNQLPEDFKKIPLEHPRSRVLASVPGTPEAAEAVLLAQIPEKARVARDLKAPAVSYQGKPEFAPIESTRIQRAVNTDKDILEVGGLYYMCFQGVWFVSKTATGPWEVTGEVPKAIYEIPASSPAYNVTYVTVESSTPSTVVYATYPAYSGVMIAWGCAVWGTGYYYPPYIYPGPYPIYYPRYPTYGYSAWYNPYTGAYGRSAAVYGPYGGAGVTARYNPRTGTYSRGAAAYGPYGARAAGSAYNPRTGAYATTRQGSNVYGSWGS